MTTLFNKLISFTVQTKPRVWEGEQIHKMVSGEAFNHKAAQETSDLDCDNLK